MGKEPKIEMRNLYWAYGINAGAIPYIFNNDRTAIKLYSEQFNFDTIQLQPEQPATDALDEHFQELIVPISKIRVYEEGFSFVEQTIRHALYGAYDFQPFSHKDIAKMQTKYNAYIAQKTVQEEQESIAKQERQAEQDAIMNF